MMKRLGIEKLKKLTLAGSFGSNTDIENAMVLGMFPVCNLINIYSVGNADGDGAKIALLNKDKRVKAEEIAGKVEYLELTTGAGFQKEFMEAMQIPHIKNPFHHFEEYCSGVSSFDDDGSSDVTISSQPYPSSET